MNITSYLAHKKYLLLENVNGTYPTIVKGKDKWYAGPVAGYIVTNFNVQLIDNNIKIEGTRIYRRYFSYVPLFFVGNGRPKIDNLSFHVPEGRKIIDTITETDHAWLGMKKVERVKWVRYEKTTKFFHLSNNFKIST